MKNGSMGGLWTSNDNNIAIVDVAGMATGIAPGTANITHAVTNSDGTSSAKVTQVVVGSSAFDVRLQPNPNTGTFTLNGTTGMDVDESVTLEVTDMLGQVIYTTKCVAMSGTINEKIELKNSLPNGMYLLNIHATVGTKVFHFVVEK